MAAADPEHWIVVDASGDVDTVFARVRAAAAEPWRDDRSAPWRTLTRACGTTSSGSPAAVAQLRRAATDPVHAYLFVGPPGSTKHEAARAFAAAVLSGDDDPGGRDARLARAGEHPDVREVERTGPYITKPQAEDIVRLAALAPVEGDRKVLVLHEFHLVQDEAAAAAAQDDRGAARLDDVPRARRLRAARR